MKAMTPTPCNEDRVDNARRTLYERRYAGSEEEGVIDLLSDLMHLCRVEGFDFQRLLGTAGMHCEAETQAVFESHSDNCRMRRANSGPGT
jgi:hypothetical protein